MSMSAAKIWGNVKISQCVESSHPEPFQWSLETGRASVKGAMTLPSGVQW